ncbi:MAG: Alcohol dehydrogenase GroES domain protein [Candidatus Saccharibacteria bacterium]|nr:Alcohol dehydrogenase GroES domain protein [Candidatus Saccharibacteria bacterium]
MKALVYKGPKEVAVEEVADPKITKPTDAIIKITSAAICGSDLHMYEGRSPAEPGIVFGHEIMGIVEEVGSGIQQIKPGDRVVLPFNISCGLCFNCVRGFTNACLNLNPDGVGAGYGYAGMGPYNGGQAERVLVPYADFNALKLPGKPGDEHEDDFLMLADIFPTAWHATKLAHVDVGHSTAIYGAGPVGLLSVMSAKLQGAGPIFIIDHHEDRLKLAEEFGAIPINFTKQDPIAFIAEYAKKTGSGMARPGEEKLNGVLSGIDAVGYQSLDFDDPTREKHHQVIESLSELVQPTGSIGLIGVYFPEDPGANDEQAKKGIFPVPLGTLWDKGITIGMGQCPVKNYDVFLRQAITTGAARPGKIVSHHIKLDDVPEFYKRFDDRENGVTKVVINPNDIQ